MCYNTNTTFHSFQGGERRYSDDRRPVARRPVSAGNFRGRSRLATERVVADRGGLARGGRRAALAAPKR